MINRKNINPIEIAFYCWTHFYPESFHPCDERRFYEFVETLHVYRKEGKRWLNEDYFLARCKRAGISSKNAELFSKRKEIILDFLDDRTGYVHKVNRCLSDDKLETSYEISYVDETGIHYKTVDAETFERTKSLKRAKEL